MATITLLHWSRTATHQAARGRPYGVACGNLAGPTACALLRRVVWENPRAYGHQPPSGTSMVSRLRYLRVFSFVPVFYVTTGSAWHNAHKKLIRCTERVEQVIDFWVAFSDVVILVRRLIREGWMRYRWEGRPQRQP